jgi:chromosome segregation ATPase
MSEYSIDLDALGPPDNHDSSILTLPHNGNHAIDVVHSEDIDGPTDFTQNMEFWMSAKLPNILKPTKLEDGEKKEDLEEYIGSDESAVDTPKQEQKTERLEHAQVDEGGDHSMGSFFSPDHNGGGISFLSDIPEDDSIVASPEPPRTVEAVSSPSRRQPTVENYEDTPIRSKGTRSASSSAVGSTLRSPELTLKTKPVLSTKDDTAKPHEASETNKNGSTTTLKSLEEALARLGNELAEVQAVLAAKESRNSSLENQISVHKLARERSENALESLQSELDLQLTRSKNTIASLERERVEVTEKSRVAREEHSEEKQDWEERYRTLRTSYERLEICKVDSDNRIEALEVGKMDSEDRIEALEADIARMRSDHENELANVKAKAEGKAQKRIAEAREEFESERADITLKLTTMEEEREELRAELALMESTASANEDGTSKSQFAALGQETASLQAQLKELQITNATTRQELQKAIEQHQSAQKTLQASLTAAQSSLAASQSHTEAAQRQTTAAQKETSETRQEMQTLREDFAAINSTVDERIKEIMRAREAEWERRFERLQREKGVMGRVLMGEWGQKELGVSEPQAYRYKFVKK